METVSGVSSSEVYVLPIVKVLKEQQKEVGDQNLNGVGSHSWGMYYLYHKALIVICSFWFSASDVGFC